MSEPEPEPPVEPEVPDFCWPVDTSCVSDWDDILVPAVEADPEADPPVEAVDAVPRYTDADKAIAVALAGQTLRFLTLYRVGGCPITVRPCRAGCSEATWRTYPANGAGSTPWQPVNLHGNWLNIGCGHDACGCSTVSEVTLHSPAHAITEVKVDGTALDASDYLLYPGGRLVRTGGEGWPLCQNLDAPDSEEGTWSVTYSPGVPVDALGARMGGILAGQYVRACTSGDCDLPQAVTQIARNGVTMTLTPGAFPGGRTGIREVDAWLERWNPYAHKSAPAVYSVDRPGPRTQGV